ncbi:MAG TPA: AMP-binding protein [Pseudonocardia sp.]|jgi:O-succinylbenzoic acid--CoA ligase
MRVVRCDGSAEEVAGLADAVASALDGGPAVLPYERVAPEVGGEPAVGVALLIETSGSTGAAKRVMLSSAALRASAAATHRRLGGPGRWLLALPAHHVAGVQVIVRGLLAGHRPVVLDNRAGFRPDGFAAAAALLPADQPRYTSLVPTQLHRVLTAGQQHGRAPLDALRSFDAVLVGGAATSDTLLRQARSAGVAVVTTYGMSETAGGCIYDGQPLDGVRLRFAPATDSAGTAESAAATDSAGAESGRIELAGPMLAAGYLGRPELTAELFADGWFRTSDFGRRDPDGRLRVLGRADDVITTGGESVHPAAVERVLTSQPGVRAACVVGVPDAEWGELVAAALVLDRPAGRPAPGGAATDADALRAAVRDELGAPSVPRRLRFLDEIPLRGIGKPDRGQVAQLLATHPEI